jgi:hypothetical protein
MTEDLEIKINKLEERLDILSNQLRKALDYIQEDPPSSLTKSRTILEQILLNIYKLEMNQEPKKFEIGALLNDNQFTRKIDRRIVSRMNAIRDMCNLGVHGENVNPKDAKIVLDNLCEVLEWYFENYKSSKIESSKTESSYYNDWIKSLEKGSLTIELDTKNSLEVESLANILLDVMTNKLFSEIDCRNTHICLIELLNNVKYHAKVSSTATIKINFENIGYNKISISIEVIDKGNGFDLDMILLDNEKKIRDGGREHGLLRAFRLGSEISQKMDRENSVKWSKIQTRKKSKEQSSNTPQNRDIFFINYNFGFSNELSFNNDYYRYQDFIKLITKFSGNLLSTNFCFDLSNSVRMFLDSLRKDPRAVVCLEFWTSHPTMVISRDDIKGPENNYIDFEPPIPSLSNIIYQYMQETTPTKMLVIACFTDIDEDNRFLKDFCKKRSINFFESRLSYNDFLDNPKSNLNKKIQFNLFKLFKK